MAERVGRLLSCGHDGFALRNVAQQFRDVCWGDNFEEFVGSISLQSSYGAGRVVDGDAFLREEVHERLLLKALVGDIDKGVLVVVKTRGRRCATCRFGGWDRKNRWTIAFAAGGNFRA